MGVLDSVKTSKRSFLPAHGIGDLEKANDQQNSERPEPESGNSTGDCDDNWAAQSIRERSPEQVKNSAPISFWPVCLVPTHLHGRREVASSSGA